MAKKKLIDTTGWSPEEITAGERLLPGLFRNGSLYWTRVKHPLTRVVKRLSTGTDDIKRANAVRRMIDEFVGAPLYFQWIEAALTGTFSLDQIYTAKSNGLLGALVEQRDIEVAKSRDTDLEPLVDKWIDNAVRGRTRKGRPISDSQIANYHAEVRRLAPKGTPFRVSDFTHERVLATINGAKTKNGSPLGPTSRRELLNTLIQFYAWVRPKVGLKVNPFDDIQKVDRPERAESRATFWLFAPYRDEPNVTEFIAALPDLYSKAIAALVFGAGAEVVTLYALTKSCLLGRDELTGQYQVQLRGTKVEERDRTAVLDEWAVPFLEEYVASLGKLGAGDNLFTLEQLGYAKGQRFREQVWYPTQVALGWIKQPAKSPETGKPLWGQAEGKHDIHDGRHTYAIVRGFGLDGAEPRDKDFIARNLGHTDTQMVTKVYSKMKRDRRDLVLKVAELIKIEKRRQGIRVVA